MNNIFNELQNEIYNLRDAANKILPAELAFYFLDTFITGKIDKPDILFLGINPGFGSADWKTRKTHTTCTPYKDKPSKFIYELTEQNKLAKEIVNVVLNGNESRLQQCAESSCRSFFATPDVSTLNVQMNLLAKAGLLDRHEALMSKFRKLVIDTIQPKQIVCVGLTTFQSFIDSYSGKHSDVVSKWKDSASGKTKPVYYKHTLIEGTPVHGIIHLSGARPSKTMLVDLRNIFQESN